MAKSFQIALSPSERSRFVDRIEQDFLNSKASHLRYAERCAGWMQKWENRVNPPRLGDERKPNHTVPMVQWQVFNKLARDLQTILGDDAEITADAVGASDVASVKKIGRYMTNRVFAQMKITENLCIFEFRRILNGWAAAYRPWFKREFTTLKNGKPTRVCDYEGPGFFPLEPDDLIVPPERGITSLQDFSFVIRRVPVSVDDLFRGDGTLYQGTSDPEFMKRAIDWAKNNTSNDYTLVGQDPVRTERERSEGVDYDAFTLGRRTLWIWEWYGKWRPLKGKKQNAEIDDLDKREAYEADWVVKYIPGMREIVGCQDLLQLYPKMRRRRPFVESSLMKDGTYRPKGFGALLEDLEDEATANSRLFVAAGELSVWPIVFFKPGGGMKPGAFQLQPGQAIPTEDPSSINVVKINPSLDYAVQRQQDIISTGERITGITDQSLGRAIDTPNAPRTAAGQLALIEEGNVRAYLDATILQTDMEQIITDFWDLDCDLVPRTEPGLFFRVTEEQSGGLFDVKQGGAYMTPEEFGGTYDFSLKFATSVWARQSRKQELLAFYELAMQNPMVAQNPKALWSLTNRLANEFNIKDFATLCPPPPDIGTPQLPQDEWTKMLEGEKVQVNPQDDDHQHIIQHTQELEDERKDPKRDVQAIGLMVQHILDHEQQIRMKQLMALITQKLMAQNQPGGPGAQLAQYMANIHNGGQSPQPGQPGQPQQQQPQPQPGAPPASAVQPQGVPGQIPPPPAAVGAQNAPNPTNGAM